MSSPALFFSQECSCHYLKCIKELNATGPHGHRHEYPLCRNIPISNNHCLQVTIDTIPNSTPPSGYRGVQGGFFRDALRYNVLGKDKYIIIQSPDDEVLLDYIIF